MGLDVRSSTLADLGKKKISIEKAIEKETLKIAKADEKLKADMAKAELSRTAELNRLNDELNAVKGMIKSLS